MALWEEPVEIVDLGGGLLWTRIGDERFHLCT